MSHFVVLVVGEDVEGQLAPYDENMDVPGYWETLKRGERWNEVKDIHEFLMREGHLKEANEWDRRGEFMATSRGKWETKNLDHTPSRELAECLLEWNSGAYRYKNGEWQHQTTYNPKSKWDWYTVGGRWQGYFRTTKPVAELEAASLGASGVFGSPEGLDRKWHADQVLKGDIDFDGMQLESITLAAKRYDEAKPEEIQMLAWPETHIEREEYIEGFKHPWIPFAIVMNGEWYQEGEMGWFGTSTTEDDDWVRHAQDMIDGLSDETLLTAVDCHI